MSPSSRLYRISWLSRAGSEHTFESDPYDAIDVARANDGIVTYDGEEYTADELLTQLEADSRRSLLDDISDVQLAAERGYDGDM